MKLLRIVVAGLLGLGVLVLPGSPAQAQSFVSLIVVSSLVAGDKPPAVTKTVELLFRNTTSVAMTSAIVDFDLSQVDQKRVSLTIPDLGSGPCHTLGEHVTCPLPALPAYGSYWSRQISLSPVGRQKPGPAGQLKATLSHAGSPLVVTAPITVAAPGPDLAIRAKDVVIQPGGPGADLSVSVTNSGSRDTTFTAMVKMGAGVAFDVPDRHCVYSDDDRTASCKYSDLKVKVCGSGCAPTVFALHLKADLDAPSMGPGIQVGVDAPGEVGDNDNKLGLSIVFGIPSSASPSPSVSPTATSSPVPGGQAAGGPSLAKTGPATLPLAAGGLLLLIAGVFLHAVTRRWSPRH